MSYIKLILVASYTACISIVALISAIFDKSYKSYYYIGKWFSKGVLFLSGVKLEVIGLEKFDHKKVYVFVSNHTSQFDIPAIQSSIPNNIGIVFKKELGKIPVFGWSLRLGPYIMVDRQNAERAMQSIEEAKLKMARRNLSPVIFAEGTRSRTGEIQSFKRGAFYLAIKAGYPIIPVSISGSHELLPKGELRIRSGTITVTFADPIPTHNVITRKDENALMEKVRNIVIENIKK